MPLGKSMLSLSALPIGGAFSDLRKMPPRLAFSVTKRSTCAHSLHATPTANCAEYRRGRGRMPGSEPPGPSTMELPAYYGRASMDHAGSGSPAQAHRLRLTGSGSPAQAHRLRLTG